MLAAPDNKEKFDRIYYEYKDAMFAAAMSVLHSEALAHETVQDCMLKIAGMTADFPEPGTSKAKSLAVIIARNKALDNLRSERPDCTEPIEDTDIPDSGDILSEVGCRTLINEIMGLDDIYSGVLILRLIYEYSVEEISSMLDIPENTVRSRIYRGRKILRQRLEDFFD